MTEKQTFTPGPWQSSKVAEGIWGVHRRFETGDLNEIQPAVFDAGVCVGQTTRLPNAHANARLIAKAPELFAALERACSEEEPTNDGEPPQWLRAARLLLAEIDHID